VPSDASSLALLIAGVVAILALIAIVWARRR